MHCVEITGDLFIAFTQNLLLDAGRRYKYLNFTAPSIQYCPTQNSVQMDRKLLRAADAMHIIIIIIIMHSYQNWLILASLRMSLAFRKTASAKSDRGLEYLHLQSACIECKWNCYVFAILHRHCTFSIEIVNSCIEYLCSMLCA